MHYWSVFYIGTHGMILVMNDSLPQFIKLAKVGDFTENRIKSFSIFAKPLAIVKDPDGTFWATEIGCKHNNFDLTCAPFKGDEVRCPRHGWIYNIRSGECLNQNSAPLRRHLLEVRGEDIYVSLTPEIEVVEDEDDDWAFEVQINPKPSND